MSSIRDFLPNFKQWQLALVTSVIGFSVGLTYVTPGGQWILNIVDYFGVSLLVFTTAILQIFFIIWVYGLENFCWDVEFMLKWKVTRFWRFSWGIVTPGLLLVIFIYSMAELELLTFMDKSYPTGVYFFGWFIYIIAVSQLLIWGVYLVLRDENKLNAFRELFKLNPVWGPKSPKIFKEWKEFKNYKKETRKIQSMEHSMVKKVVWILLGKYE